MRYHPTTTNGPERWSARLSRALSIAVLGFLGGKLAILLTNLWWFPSLKRDSWSSALPKPADDQPITLLVPLRDEALRLPGTLPGLLAAGADEIIFLDDQSTDGSAELLHSLNAARPTNARPIVRVVAGEPRPAGWVGKTWACEQLAAATDAELLVFCDADVELLPGALAAVVAEMRRQQADVFSVICRQRTVSWAERLLTPLITDVVLCLFPFGLLRAPAPSAATAEGMLLVFRRPAYNELGGFAAVRGELVEDVAIARLTRRRGLQLGLVLGGELVQARMYTGYRQIVDGLGRGLAPVVGGRRWLVAAGWLLHVAAYTAPVALLFRSGRWRVAALLGITERVLVEAKTGGRDWPAAMLVSASPLAALPVVLRAMRRRQVWKGRTYG
ncbi:MAG: glycosyltransferase family 2 protein [Nakamurella sp.]